MRCDSTKAMKIIIVNKYHYIDGGPERYMFGLSDYLKSLGHEVIPLAMAYSKNLPSEYDKYFVQPAGGCSETKLGRLEAGLGTRLKVAAQTIYSMTARKALERLIADTQPDLVYCLNIVNHMSPSVIDAAHKYHVPVVMRLSDYNLICPSHLFLRDGQICTECERGYYRSLKYKCVQGSLAATTCRAAGMYIHKLLGIYKKVNTYVAPAKFMKDTLVRAGFPEKKIHHIPTFVNSSCWTPRYDNDGYILYFGRLTPEKGIEFLLRAYAESGVGDPLMIVGDGPDDYVDRLKSGIDEISRGKVNFLGHKSGEELQEIVRGAKYVVVPSLWYDNTPNVVYESFAAGKPVVASALGGLCEQVTEETGVLVEPGNICELTAAITRLSSAPELLDKMGRSARRLVEQEYGIENHVKRLLGLFEEVIECRERAK